MRESEADLMTTRCELVTDVTESDIADVTGVFREMKKATATETTLPYRCTEAGEVVQKLQAALDGARAMVAQGKVAAERELQLQIRFKEAEEEKVIACRLLALAREELTQLQKEVRESKVREVPTRDVRKEVTSLVEAAMIGRTAEALRRQDTDCMLMKVAAREEVYKQTTHVNAATCCCYAVTQTILAAGAPAMDATNNPRLTSTVTEMLASASVGQQIDLYDHQISNFHFKEEEDREKVQEAVVNGRSRLVPFQILTKSLCRNTELTARARVNELFTGVTGLMDIVSTPPVDHEEAV